MRIGSFDLVFIERLLCCFFSTPEPATYALRDSRCIGRGLIRFFSIYNAPVSRGVPNRSSAHSLSPFLLRTPSLFPKPSLRKPSVLPFPTDNIFSDTSGYTFVCWQWCWILVRWWRRHHRLRFIILGMVILSWNFFVVWSVAIVSCWASLPACFLFQVFLGLYYSVRSVLLGR